MNWDSLTEALSDHTASYGDWRECSCGYPNPGSKHLTAVVREWVEGQMTEERTTYPPYHTTLFRRLVTPWAPVEGGKP